MSGSSRSLVAAPDHTRRHLDDLIASCPAMTTLTQRAREFADIRREHEIRMLKRQSYGRATFALLRKRIPLVGGRMIEHRTGATSQLFVLMPSSAMPMTRSRWASSA